MTMRKAKLLKFLNEDRNDAIESSPKYDTRPILPATPKFPINILPFDIREKILEADALDFGSSYSPSLRIRVFLPGRNGQASTAIRLPPISQAGDRKLRLECILITIKLISFEIHSGPGNAKLQKWLGELYLQGSGETRLGSGFDAVRSLFFPYFSRYPYYALDSTAPNNDIQLMRRCNNLRTVKALFVGSELHDYHTGGPKSVQQLRDNYRLDGMLELANLRTLALQCYGVASDDSGLQAVKKWFEGEFGKRKRPTKVVIEDPYQ